MPDIGFYPLVILKNTGIKLFLTGYFWCRQLLPPQGAKKGYDGHSTPICPAGIVIHTAVRTSGSNSVVLIESP
jgi:hypothetical protein